MAEDTVRPANGPGYNTSLFQLRTVESQGSTGPVRQLWIRCRPLVANSHRVTTSGEPAPDGDPRSFYYTRRLPGGKGGSSSGKQGRWEGGPSQGWARQLPPHRGGAASDSGAWKTRDQGSDDGRPSAWKSSGWADHKSAKESSPREGWKKW